MNLWLQLIAALITIFVATVVYRWQKNIDRQTIIQTELRKHYSDFLQAASNSFETIIYFDPGEPLGPMMVPDLDPLLLSAKVMIDVFGEDRVLSKADAVVSALGQLRPLKSLTRHTGDRSFALEIPSFSTAYQIARDDFKSEIRKESRQRSLLRQLLGTEKLDP